MRLRHVVVLVLLAAACGKDKESPPATSETPPGSESASPPGSDAASEGQDAAQAAGQSFKEGMQALCDSIDAVPPGDDPAQRQIEVARWLDVHVTNPQVRELFTLIGEMPPAQRPSMLSAAATKAGLQSCALAER